MAGKRLGAWLKKAAIFFSPHLTLELWVGSASARATSYVELFAVADVSLPRYAGRAIVVDVVAFAANAGCHRGDQKEKTHTQIVIN
jgi:hypothetical protein